MVNVNVLALMDAVRADLAVAPVLADALEESGFTDQDMLRELRAKTVFGRDPYRSEVGKLFFDLLAPKVVVLPAQDERTGTLRKRTVNSGHLASEVMRSAVGSKVGRAWKAKHGGSVANAYKYPAYTEGVLAAAVYDRDSNTVRVKVWGTQLPANKVTLGGVVAQFGFRALCDDRYGTALKNEAKEAMYAEVSGVASAVSA